MTNFEARINELEYENSSLKRDFKQVLHLNEELRINLDKRDKKIEILEKKVSKLETELEKYKVKPNEPSGSKPDFEKQNQINEKKKPGQKPGHKGTTRKSPKNIHKILNYKPKCCEHCGSNKIKESNKREKIISDLEFKVVNSKEIYHDCRCLNCGKETKPQSIHGNSKSPFGRNFQTLIAYLRSVCGTTIRPIENLFKDYFKFEVTDTSILNNEIRLSKEGYLEYNRYLELVKQAQYSHKDETSYRINGKTNWIWVYDSPKYVFYRMADSRAMKVVNEDFGLKPKQISINDCYSAYNRFEYQQICWAHLLREAEEHSIKENATKKEKVFYSELKEIYRKAIEFSIGDPPINRREEMRTICENNLADLMNLTGQSTNFLRRIVNRLNERLRHCFLFVEVESLPSTNNKAERSLRPFVCHRKVSQGSKSWVGAEAKVILKTLYENCKRDGKQAIHALEFLFEKQKERIVITTT